jgi:hypothetical protein
MSTLLGLALTAAAIHSAGYRTPRTGPLEAAGEATRGIATAPYTAPRITLRVFDPRGELTTGIGETVAEVAAIFGGVGIDVWWEVADPRRSEVMQPLTIPVVALRPPPRTPGKGRVMGMVLRGGGTPSPIWVVPDNVRWTLGLGRELTTRESGELARAVGRVIAHEIVHSIAPDHPHEGRGLMRPTLGRRALLRAFDALAPECSRALARALASLPAEGTVPRETRVGAPGDATGPRALLPPATGRP